MLERVGAALCALLVVGIGAAPSSSAAPLPWAPAPVNSCGEVGFDPVVRLPDPHAPPAPLLPPLPPRIDIPVPWPVIVPVPRSWTAARQHADRSGAPAQRSVREPLPRGHRQRAPQAAARAGFGLGFWFGFRFRGQRLGRIVWCWTVRIAPDRDQARDRADPDSRARPGLRSDAATRAATSRSSRRTGPVDGPRPYACRS